MPINPSIAGTAITPQEPIDLLGSLGKVAAIKSYQARAAEEQRKAQKAQQIEALASQYPDPEDFIAAAHKIDPMFAAEFGKKHEEAKTAKLTTYGKELETEGKTVDRYLRMLQATDGDPKLYALWRQGITQAAPEFGQMLPPPEQYTPEAYQSILSMGDSIANTLKVKHEATQAFLKGDYRRGLAEAVSGAPNLQVARSYLEEARGVAPKGDIQYVEGILASMPDFPSAQQALKQGALTANEQQLAADKAADNVRADAAAQRQLAKDAQDAAAEAARLAVSRGHLAVSQGQLGVAREKLAQDKADKVAGKTGTAMTPSMKAGIERLRNTINQLKGMDKSLTQQEGLTGKVVGRAQQGWANLTGMDEDATVYDGLADTLLPALARASGEVGNLAQQEQERYGKLAPRVTDPKNVRRKKIAAIEQLVIAAEEGATATDMKKFLDYDTAEAESTKRTNPFRK